LPVNDSKWKKVMKSFIRFTRGTLRMPFYWQPWLLLLVTVNAVIPIFFVGRLEAQMVLGAMVISVILMTLVTGLTGFSRLVGLGHYPWFPLLYFLWTRLDQIPADDFFGIWVRALMVLNALSLVIDTVDAVRYVAGEREETV
jgi:hypothetical protein